MNVQFGGTCCRFGSATTPMFMANQGPVGAPPAQAPKLQTPAGVPMPPALAVAFGRNQLQSGRFSTLA